MGVTPLTPNEILDSKEESYPGGCDLDKPEKISRIDQFRGARGRRKRRGQGQHHRSNAGKNVLTGAEK